MPACRSDNLQRSICIMSIGPIARKLLQHQAERGPGHLRLRCQWAGPLRALPLLHRWLDYTEVLNQRPQSSTLPPLRSNELLAPDDYLFTFDSNPRIVKFEFANLRMKFTPSLSSISWTVAMFGWLSAAADFASRTNLSIRSRFAARSGGRIFSATFRSSLVSLAKYTSPIPPAPSCDRIW